MSGRIYTEHLKESADVCKSVLNFLNGLEGAGFDDFNDKKVLLKPNLVAPFPKAVTHPGIIRAVSRFVKSKGGRPFMAESSGFEFETRETFEILGLKELGREEELDIINLDEKDYSALKTGDRLFPELLVFAPALDADIIFNLPKLKKHSLTGVTFSSKNLMGLIHRRTRRDFHARNIEHGISLLADVLEPGFILIDGLAVLSRAVYGTGDYCGLIAFSRSSLSIDKFSSETLGIDYRSIEHIRLQDYEEHTYEVEGDRERCSVEPLKPAPGKLIYRGIFKTAYILDRFLTFLGRKSSIIPDIHWYLGIRPAIGKPTEEALLEGEKICPVNAIDAERAVIIKERCIKARCLKCTKIKPEGSFITKGFRRP